MKFQAALQHLNAGRFAEAEQACRGFLHANPDDADGLAVLAVILGGANHYSESKALFKRLIEREPDQPVHYMNLGTLLRDAGEYEASVEVFRKALKRWPGLGEVAVELGLSLFAAGMDSDAPQALETMPRIHDNHMPGLLCLARRCLEAGDQTQAELYLKSILRRRLGSARLYNELGIALSQVAMHEEAELAFRESLRLEPGFHYAHLNLAELYERNDRITDARRELKLASQWPKAQKDPWFVLLDARVARHEGKRVDQVDELMAIASGAPSRRTLGELHFEIGRELDEQGRYAEAYESFQWANQNILADARLYGDYPHAVLHDPHDTENVFNAAIVQQWRIVALPDDLRSPVFVVGFPGSGASLLGRILDAYPDLQTMQEKPAVPEVMRQLHALPGGYPEALGILTSKRVLDLQLTYWKTVERYIELQDDKNFVDACGFNIRHLPLIHRVFPSAKFILVVRHPCDVCLSCFQRKFQMYSGTIAFAEVAEIAVLYSRIMRAWLEQTDVFRPNLLVTKYEDLINDVGAEMCGILRFCGLPRDKATLDYCKGRTPRGCFDAHGNAQAVTPVNQPVIGTWQNYSSHFAEALPHLRPFLRLWGYGETMPVEGEGRPARKFALTRRFRLGRSLGEERQARLR